MVPFQILLSHLDVVKDVVLVIRLLQSIGWYLDPTQFSSMVRFSTILFKQHDMASNNFVYLEFHQRCHLELHYTLQIRCMFCVRFNNSVFILVQAVLGRPNWLIFDWNYWIRHKTKNGFEVCNVIGQPIGISLVKFESKIFLDAV